MIRRPRLGRIFCSCLIASALWIPSARAQQARAVGVTPPRLSFVDGDVSYWRPGADDWVRAQINTALGAGDSLYADSGGNFELEIGTRAYVRGGPGTQLGIDSLETGYLQLRVPAGYAAVDLRRIPEGQEIELDTPNGAFLISLPGYYRFDVDDRATRFTVRRGGSARVFPAGANDGVEVGSSQTVVVSGTDTADLQRVAPADEDAWDRWNYDRTASLGGEPLSARYVSPEVAGVDDLDRYGDWRSTSSYGAVWVPRGTPSGWSPYTTGRWVWDGYYGWTWVDDAPWGWAPYHYGRWCWVDGYWGWAPGPLVARPVYAPALVAFFGSGGVSVSIGIGTPFVSWVPLGWGEPVVPWWGPRGFVGRPYWGGWGGPRVVNNTVIKNTTIINVNNINYYDNVRHRAVIGVDGNRFGRGRLETVRVDADRMRTMRPVRGELGIRPVRESLVPRESRGQQPPARIQSRQVVATRAPQDPSRLPRARGLIRETDAARRPESRIVVPRGSGMNRLERAGGRTAPPPTRGGVERVPREPGRGSTAAPELRREGELNERGGIERGTGRSERPARTQQSEPPERAQPPSRPVAPDSPRSRSGASGEAAPPPRTGAERPEAPRIQRQERPRMQRPEAPQMQRQEAPRMQRPEAPRMQRQEAPRMQRPEAPQMQRQEAPRMQRPEVPRMQRQEAPRMQRQEAPQMQRQEAPRMQRPEVPQMQRQEAPRMQRPEAPRMQRQEAPRTQRPEAPQMQRQEAPRTQRRDSPPRGDGNRGSDASDRGRRDRD